MFNNKYNPDILNNYNDMEKFYNNTKYELKNKPYKLIINDDNILKNNNFKINIDNTNNKKIIEKFQKIYDKRNTKSNKKLSKKNIEEIKNKFKLRNTELFNSNNEMLEDYEDMKDNFISDYKEKEEEIKKERQNFNNILDSLLEEGILD